MDRLTLKAGLFDISVKS